MKYINKPQSTASYSTCVNFTHDYLLRSTQYDYLSRAREPEPAWVAELTNYQDPGTFITAIERYRGF